MDSSDCHVHRFDIDPRDYGLNKAYAGCVLIWSFGIVGFGIACVIYQIWVLVAFAGVLGLIIPLVLNSRHEVQSLLVDDDGLCLMKNNDMGSCVRISREAVMELTLEYVEAGGEVGQESVSTLNLWDCDHGYRRRHILGVWISESGREQLYELLKDFLAEANFRVTATNKLANGNETLHSSADRA